MPDQVILLTTPPFLHVLFIVRRWFSRRPVELVLWNQDTYPEILAAVGLMRADSVAYRLLLAVDRWGVRRLDRVLVLDRGMEKKLTAQGARVVRVVPNWEIAQDPETGPRSGVEPGNEALLARIQAAKHQCQYVVVYTGNYGWGHNLELVHRYLRDHPRQHLFYFVFIGGGEKWPLLEQLRAETESACVEIVSYLPRQIMQAALRESHFGLVALEQACVGLMSPSKIHGYLAMGKPLIYLGPDGSNVAEAIAAYDCGFSIAENDASAWAAFVNKITDAGFSYQTYAGNASRAFADRYREQAGVSAFCAAVE